MQLGGIIKADISGTLADGSIPWDELRDSSALITGATGLIGGILTRTALAANTRYKLNMRIIAHGRNSYKCEALAREPGLEVVAGDIREPGVIAGAIDRLDYVFHCAAMTSSADMLAKPVDVITTAVCGTRNMLELAREKYCKSFVYLSSAEVYGRSELREVCEDDLGYIDLSDPRGSYPESKRLCEALCAAYASQYGVPAKIARLARTCGAGTPNDANDTRVANQFARKAVAGEDIELHTPGNSVANCCYTADAARGLLPVLLKGKAGEAYNIANPAANATIREMAELVAKDVCGGRIKVVVSVPEDIQKRGYAPDVGYTLSAGKLKALGWSPRHGLGEMYRRMIADWHGL